jgi:hypothetical protein
LLRSRQALPQQASSQQFRSSGCFAVNKLSCKK